ncbi:MAG: phage tail protein [Sphingomonas bacterium]|uniref:phage tail protein n=1 Tax=Sphingomonas bacterium TaxID=1895847 RepID=UPI00262C44E6|nr:phage tail protein [Sphingomonas bacterium]MDB5706037.1 phage tail protein [Sphingomonas bacterium]
MPMTLPPEEESRVPYGNFAFHVAIEPAAGSFAPYTGINAGLVGSFSEVSGMEAVMEHKVIKIGGHNYGTAMRAGPVTFGTVILKRGVIRTQLLWRWWSLFAGADGAADGRPVPKNRGHVLIGLIRSVDEGDTGKAEAKIRLGWRLLNAMPVKFRVADLNAKGTDVAIEELHLVHEGLEMTGVAA